MKERIFTGWTITRGLYFMMGILVIVQALIQQQWIAALFGGYFAAMGLFAFGCAAGHCYTPKTTNATPKSNAIEDIDFEEIKTK